MYLLRLTMNLTKLLFYISLLMITACELFSANNRQELEALIIAKIDMSNALKGLTETKVEAAVNLAAIASGKYYLISREYRDSVIEKLIADGETPTIIKAAKQLGVSRILFIKINRLENILRVDLQSVENDSLNTIRSGKGYANLWLRHEETDEILYDPALLSAFQRAFAAAEDSNMYSKTDSALVVYPAKSLAIGSISYQDKNLPSHWDIIKDKIIGSYEAVETIFQEAKNSKNYIVLDTPSRDSIYALFRLYLIENYTPMSIHEIEALHHLDVDCFISGTLRNKKNAVELELSLFEITEDGYALVKNEQGLIRNDSRKEYIKIIKELTKRLLDIE